MPSWPVFLPTISGVLQSMMNAAARLIYGLRPQTTSSTHSPASIGPGLRREYGLRWPCSCTRPLMEMRRHIPESTGSCRRYTWSAFPPLCSDQSSAGTVRETVYRWRPGLPGRRTNHLEQPAGQHDICPVSQSLSTFRSVSVQKHFCSRPRSRRRSLTLSLISGKIIIPHLQ